MLHATSGDAEFLHLLRTKAFSGAVHSVFRHAVNLHNYADDNLYAVVSAQFGNIPDTLLIDDSAFDFIDIKAGADVHVGDNALLFIGSTAISFAKCREWTGRLPILHTGRDHILANVAVLESLIAARGKPGGMKAAPDASTFAKEVSRTLTEVSSGLVTALASGQNDNALERAVSLIGLGPGLTPSGDDFLTGLLAALHCSPPERRRDIHRTLGDTITERAAKATNAISATALNNAALGRIPERVITLLEELGHRNPQQLISAVALVMKIGSSSGTDMLYGIAAGLKLVVMDMPPE